MGKIIDKIKSILVHGLLGLTFAWIFFALSFQVYALFLVATDNDDELSRITTEVTHKVDGAFKNDPENIWYVKK